MKKQITYLNNLHELCKLNNSKYDVNSEKEAYNFCKNIAKGHYENFVVGSLLIPKKISKYFYAIYAFARIGDDIADEITKTNDADIANTLLTQYEANLNLIYNATSKIQIKNPVFLALQDTVLQNHIEIAPFSKLLTAFRSDIYFSNFDTFDALFDYCSKSANPVGELILMLFKENSAQTIHYSNCICTALQLINFWQDISIDILRKRCYIPTTLLNPTSKQQNYYKYINSLSASKLQAILTECYNVTKEKLSEGEKILKCIKNTRLKLELHIIIFMAKRMLAKIVKLGNDIVNVRPSF